MRPAAVIVITVLVTVLLSSSPSAAFAAPSSTSSSSSSSHSSKLSVLFPAIASALRDLTVVDSDDIGYLTIAKRNLRFMFGAMVSPLQLLDWSQWSSQPPSAVLPTTSTTDSDGGVSIIEQERYKPEVAPMADAIDEDADFALHGDPSHVIRVTVNAHNQRAVPRSPDHFVDSSEPSTTEPTTAYFADTATGLNLPTQHRMYSMQRADAMLDSTAAPPAMESSSVEHSLYNQMDDSSSSSSYDPDPYSSTGGPPIIPIYPDSSSSSSLPYVPLPSSSSSAPLPPPSSGCNQFIRCGPGKAVNFTLYNSTLDKVCTRQLCVCPYDHTGPHCDYHYVYSCRPWLLADTQQQCMAVQRLPQATAYASHSERRANTHISASPSDYFTYEAILSGPPPPCLVLDERVSDLSFNFTCWFWAQDTAETWGDYGRWNRTVTDGWTFNDTMPTFDYYVLNIDPETNRTIFAVSAPYDPIRVAIRIHNTVHPSQYNHTTLTLYEPNLQYNPTLDQVAPLSLPFDLRTLPYNFKRGGRLLFTLSFAANPWGLDGRSSGMPWQLTVEDGTWQLPGPTPRVLLTRWQTAAVVLIVVVVLLLLVWRWYQRRQTAKMQALMAELRGKQQSWFEHTD